MRLLVPSLLACAAMLPVPAGAEIRAAGGSWGYDLSGTVRQGRRSYDFDRDLELDAEGRTSALLEWDTAPGFWPDVAASYSEMGAGGDHEETFTLMAGGVPVGSETRTIVTAAGFDDVDVTLRYPFPVGPVRCAVGIAVKRLRGNLVIEDSEETSPTRQSYDETFPQVHAQLRWPATDWLTVAGSMQGITHDGSAAREWRGAAEARVGWLLVEAGWLEKHYDIKVNSYALDARLRGPVLRLGVLWR